MVAQIGIVSSDIRGRIEKIETFSLLKLKGKGPGLTTMAKAAIGMRLLTPMATAGKVQVADENATAATAMTQNELGPPGKNVTFAECPTLPIREYFHLIDQHRDEKVRKMKELFESIGPILIKLESLILGTFTGESTKMKLCYAYWENELFGLLIRYGLYIIHIL